MANSHPPFSEIICRLSSPFPFCGLDPTQKWSHPEYFWVGNINLCGFFCILDDKVPYSQENNFAFIWALTMAFAYI